MIGTTAAQGAARRRGDLEPALEGQSGLSALEGGSDGLGGAERRRLRLPFPAPELLLGLEKT